MMPTNIIFITLEPTYKKDNGTWVLHTNEVVFPEYFTLAEQSLVSIPVGAFGGNHKHPRIEAYIAFHKELYLIWQDENGEKHEENMYDASNIKLWIIPPFVPHAVVNRAEEDAMFYEFANDTQHDVEVVTLV